MDKNKIILIILFIIIIPIAYFAITGYLHELEEQTFYDSIKQISDIENNTDIKGDNVREKTSPSTDEFKEYCNDYINTTSTEIDMLQDLKTKVSNESYIEFIDIQINRLNSENRVNNAMLEGANTLSDYYSGSTSYSEAMSIINDKNKEIDSYSDKTSEYKVEADSFLSIHTDMKEKFNELGIDEDFLYNQIEKVNTKNISK